MKHLSNQRLRACLIVLFWLILWQAGAWITDNSILLVGPFEVIRALAALLRESGFWLSAFTSFAKISLGFLGAFILGILLGWLAFHFSFLQEFLAPVMTFLKSVPVASFVILALIWAGSKNLSVLIAFLVVLPIIYVNTIAGLSSTDRKLLEMAQVFSIGRWQKIRFLYWPALLPYLTSACRTALGMSWKSGVAAEVIGVPDNTIGEGLYMSKIYLDTAGLFAWTLVIILASGLFERLFLLLLAQTGKGLRGFRRSVPFWPGMRSRLSQPSPPPVLSIERLHKTYDGAEVLAGLTLTLTPNKPWCIMAPSGFGKTTLFRILLGLETADSGRVQWMHAQGFAKKESSQMEAGLGGSTEAAGGSANGRDIPPRISAVFQEDRLCEAFSPIDNIRLAVPGLSRTAIAAELKQVLPEECLNRPVSTLSGGMKRRTAIMRAMLFPSAAVIMDEPFTGLDEETKALVIRYIRKNSRGKLLLLSTHQEEDVELLNGISVRLNDVLPLEPVKTLTNAMANGTLTE